MSKYLVKRVLLAILSILIVSAITFFVMNLIPGGPFNKEKATMAGAFKAAIEAGRSAYLSGLGRVLERGASASDPLTGFLRD